MLRKHNESHCKNASRLVFGTTLNMACLTFRNFNSDVELFESTIGV